MIDPKILAYARNRISLELRQLDGPLDMQIAQERATANARGMLRSGNMVMAVQTICVEQTHRRVQMAWEILYRALANVGIDYDPTHEKELQEFLESFFPEHMDGLKERVRQAAAMTGIADLYSRITDEIGPARRAALDRAFSEISLYLMTVEKTPTPAPYSPYIHIQNSTVGSVQTGDSSIANVNIGIQNEQSQALVKALELVSEALAKIGNLPDGNKGELIEIVDEVKAEFQKEKPNSTKLSYYLPAIGGAISTIAELKPAYDALKNAAALFNITLP